MINNYYQKHKEKLQKVAPERYQNLSEKGTEIKRQYHRVIRIFLRNKSKTKLSI